MIFDHRLVGADDDGQRALRGAVQVICHMHLWLVAINDYFQWFSASDMFAFDWIPDKSLLNPAIDRAAAQGIIAMNNNLASARDGDFLFSLEPIEIDLLGSDAELHWPDS